MENLNIFINENPADEAQWTTRLLDPGIIGKSVAFALSISMDVSFSTRAPVNNGVLREFR